MSDDLILDNTLSEENIEKIKVSSAEIVVHGTREEPYYEIECFDLHDNEMHVGYSSYNLDTVFGYLEKYFEIANEKEHSDQSRDQRSGDLISRKAVIKAVDRHTRDDGTLDDDISIILEEVKTAFDKEKIIEELKSWEKASHDAGIQSTYAELDNKASEYYHESLAYHRTIEIVEKGGIE